MRRALKWIGWTLVVLIAVPLVLVAGVLIGANTDPGRHLIERETASLTGGMVRISGLSGRFPDALRVAQAQVSDASGVYVTLDDVVLDWSPLALLQREALVDRVTAARIALTRLPVSSSGSSSSGGGSSQLPVKVVVRQLEVPQVEVAAAVAGTASVLSVAGVVTLDTLTTGQGQVTIDGAGGRYTLEGAVDAQTIRATLAVREPAHGLIASVAKLPDLGAIAVDARLDGPRDAVATGVTVSAGPLRAAAKGSVDLTHEAANMTVSAQAPAMSPSPDVAWQSVDIQAKVVGPFTRPDATGSVRIDDLKAAGAVIAALRADLSGNAGLVTLHAQADGLHLPGSQADLLANAPLLLDATARLDAPARPVTFALHHPLLEVAGSTDTAGPIQAQMTVTVPDLAPFAAGSGVAVQGRTALTLHAAQTGDTTAITAQGSVSMTDGPAPAPALLGTHTKLEAAATLKGQNVTVSKLTLNGRAIDVNASGSYANKVLAVSWGVGLTDLSALQASLKGRLDATGRVGGMLDDLSVAADLTGEVAGAGYQSGQLTAHVEASGLPAAPQATVTAQGSLLGAPLDLALAGSRRDGAIQVTINRAAWKSARAEGRVALAAGASIPTGQVSVSMGRLADLSPLLGRALTGSIEAKLDADDRTAKLTASGKGVGLPGVASIASLGLDATVADPMGRRVVDATLSVGNAKASGYGGSARLTARGPIDAVAVALNASSPDLAGSAARVETVGTLDALGRTLRLASLQAVWKQQTLRLLAPMRIGFADGVSVDRLRLGLRQAELEVAGKAGSTLDLTAHLTLPADLAALFSPAYAANGMVTADARITGTTARPAGTVRLTATGVKLRNGPGSALPAASLTAGLMLEGVAARVDVHLVAGRSHVTVLGRAPLSATGALDLHTDGLLDLAMLDPLLAAGGEQARGQVSLNAAIGGTVKAPAVSGSATLVGGDIQDIPLGVHLTDVAALVEGTGSSIRLTRLSAKAGPGTIGGSGSIELGGAMPVDLRVTADNARPLSSDLLTALIDLRLTVQGELAGAMRAAGTVHVRRADIRVPDKLPSSVAVIPVRTYGVPQPKAPPPAKPIDLALAVTLDAPEQIFIRGRGLDAELGGKVVIGGTLAAPQPTGGLTLRRGTLSLAGQTLTFTKGDIDFTGAGLADPGITLVAQNVTSAMTATLTVSGSARDPKILLSSVPDAPQDEILAQLLFNASTAKLSPFQMAEIAAALASLSGATSGVGDPLSSVRSSLGLDRLSVGSDSTGNPTLEAGRYVARGVYVGAKQSASGGGTQATVSVDLAKGLKLETTAGSGTSTATGATGSQDGASVGLTYQFQY
jgi:translocation and assembly module TamB